MDRQPTLIGKLVRLRPLSEDDRDALHAVAADPLIWEQHPAHDRWQPQVFTAFFDDALAKGGALAVEDAATGALIGSTRFQSHDPANGGEVEIGWTFLARSHWRNGTNREMKRLMLDHAFAEVARVWFTIGADNMRSRRAAEGIGARWTGEVQHTADGNRVRYLIESPA